MSHAKISFKKFQEEEEKVIIKTKNRKRLPISEEMQF